MMTGMKAFFEIVIAKITIRMTVAISIETSSAMSSSPENDASVQNTI